MSRRWDESEHPRWPAGSHIMDYELDTLSHSVADRKAAGLADAKRLRRLADAIQEAGRRR